MSGFSSLVENRLLDHIVGGTAYQPTAPLYLALTTAAVTDADTGSTIAEPTYTGYARIPVAVSQWSAAANGEKHNAEPLVFSECTAGSDTIVGFALCSASTGGDVIAYGDVPESLIDTGKTPEFVTGALSLGLD